MVHPIDKVSGSFLILAQISGGCLLSAPLPDHLMEICPEGINITVIEERRAQIARATRDQELRGQLPVIETSPLFAEQIQADQSSEERLQSQGITTQQLPERFRFRALFQKGEEIKADSGDEGCAAPIGGRELDKRSWVHALLLASGDLMMPGMLSEALLGVKHRRESYSGADLRVKIAGDA